MATYSFEELLQAHLDDMYAFAFYLSGSKEAAEDLVQDLFVNLKLRQVNTEGVRNPRAWLASLLYRLFVDQWRKEQRSPIQYAGRHDGNFGEDCIAKAIDASPGPEVLLQLQEEQEQLYLALQELPAKHKHVIILHDIQGYSLAEVEQIVAAPKGTLKSRLHRAREKLLHKLQKMQSRQLSKQPFI
ncbi:MAG: hypothetical protein AMJ53_07000 [Gammaproteobacteria bacterium SG8_11]|nr:MAG: hypothetical protein AMJ53_07000 [Gammaproteobacteria bacterium SG8_11]